MEMEDKNTTARRPRAPVDIPRTAKIEVNRNQTKSQKEPGKERGGSNGSRIAQRAIKDAEKKLKSQEDSGMSTLGYGIAAANRMKAAYDAVHTVNAEVHRTVETVYKGASKASEAPAKDVNASAYRMPKKGGIIKRAGSYGVNYVIDSAAKSEDDATQVMGKTAKTMRYVHRIRQSGKAYDIKPSNPAPKAAGISVKGKGKQKLGEQSVAEPQMQKAEATPRKRINNYAKRKAVKAAQKAGAKVIAALAKAAAGVGTGIKLLLVLAVIIVFIVVYGIISGSGGIVSVLFSPFVFDDSGKQVDESAFLQAAITTKRSELITSVKKAYDDNLVGNGGEYHYVRFFNSITDMEVVLNDTNIDTSLYTVLEYQQFIQPIFHTVMLSQYELKASENQMKDLLNDIWDKISVLETAPLPMEYCNMTKTDNPDGTYVITPVEDNDGLVHADEANCPNMGEQQYHADDISKPLCSCDSFYYECEGHEGDCNHSCNDDCAGGCDHQCGDDCKGGCTHECDSGCDEYCGHTHKAWTSPSSPGCHDTDYHGNMDSDCGNSTKHLSCGGYRVCNGHKILSLTVDLKDFDELLQLYYLDEIEELEAKDAPTLAELKRLRELKDYYQVCTEYIVVLVEEFGFASGELVTLDGVELTPLTAYACHFVGKPYIWGGTDPERGADCSGFVRYVYAHFGTDLPRVSADQVAVGSQVDSITDAQAGDLIFWSNDGTDGGVYHVAIYLGNDKIVHASNSKPYPNGGIKISYVYGTIYKIKRP